MLFLFARLLIGAPLDQNRQPNTTRSGALWKCPLTPAVRDCEQIVTDGKRSEYYLLNSVITAKSLENCDFVLPISKSPSRCNIELIPLDLVHFSNGF